MAEEKWENYKTPSFPVLSWNKKKITRDERVEDWMPHQYARMIKSRSMSQMHCCLTAMVVVWIMMMTVVVENHSAKA